MMTDYPPMVTVNQVFEAMASTGLFRRDERIRRIVIDMNAGSKPVIMYIERYADKRLLDVIPSVTGVEIRTGIPEEDTVSEQQPEAPETRGGKDIDWEKAEPGKPLPEKTPEDGS